MPAKDSQKAKGARHCPICRASIDHRTTAVLQQHVNVAHGPRRYFVCECGSVMRSSKRTAHLNRCGKPAPKAGSSVIPKVAPVAAAAGTIGGIDSSSCHLKVTQSREKTTPRTTAGGALSTGTSKPAERRSIECKPTPRRAVASPRCPHCGETVAHPDVVAHFAVHHRMPISRAELVSKQGIWSRVGMGSLGQRGSMGPELNDLPSTASDKAGRYQQARGNDRNDASRAMDSMFREPHGAFGSHASFDDMDD